MKLFLDGRQELPDFVSRSEICDQLSNSGKDAVSVVTDYLHEIYEHTKKQLVGRYGATFVEDTEIQWVLTVPAIWSDAAKDATLAAARRAKIGPALSLISEPEAAAIYTLQAMQPKQLKVGNNYVVCDAGGGTVDLISYEIKSKDPLRVEESVEGSGACCGGAVLNAEFEKLIRSKMGDYAFSELCKNRPKAWTSAMNFFESYVKRVYDPSSPKSFNIPFPGVANDDDADIDEGFMRLSSREVGNMFKPILLDILNLVKGQIDSLRLKGKLISGVILVGGFGKSTCLKEFLKYSLEGKSDGTGRAVSNTRFEILQPAHAWSAVARGAVLRGIEDEDLVGGSLHLLDQSLCVLTSSALGTQPQVSTSLRHSKKNALRRCDSSSELQGVGTTRGRLEGPRAHEVVHKERRDCLVYNTHPLLILPYVYQEGETSLHT